MSKFTLTLKGLMALALGSFALGASAALPTASDTPSGGNFAENTTWYQWQKNGSNAYIVNLDAYKTTSGDNFLLNKTSLPTATEDFPATQWCFVGDNENGYTIYNHAAGTDSKLGVEVGTSNNGENSKVKLYSTSELNDNIVTQFYIGESTVKAGCIYIELFTTKAQNGNHHMFNLRGSNLSLWTTCGNNARATDAGNAFVLNESSTYAEALATAKTDAKAAVEGVQQFYHDQKAFNDLLNDINNATSITDVNNCVNRVMTALNGKIVHLTYYPKKDTENQYLGVVGDGDKRVAKLLPEMGARTKWQLVRVGTTNTFKLRNIASDTYVHQSNNGQTSNTSNLDFTFEFKNNTAVQGGVTIKYSGSWVCLDVVEQLKNNNNNVDLLPGHTNVLHQTTSNESNKDNSTCAWKVTPAGIDIPSIPSDGGYFVIRSNRGLTGTSYTTGGEYPGSLLGCYTPDREKARSNQGYSTGVHLRQYMTGMQTIWKIVPQSGGNGYKIYSIMGEDADGNPSMGMTIDDNGYITITENPTAVNLISVTEYGENGLTSDNKSPLPNGIAIYSTTVDKTNCFDLSNALPNDASNSKHYNDYYLKGNANYNPGQETSKTNQGTVFYLERVSSTDVEAAKEAFIKYAAENHMFGLLKNVLTDEEEAYALAQKKTTDASSISTVAAARAYLEEGEQAASTRAFECLNGKVVRFANRLHNGRYMRPHSDAPGQLSTGNTDVDADLNYLWEIKVVNAGMRQIQLKNIVTGTYAGSLPGRDNTAFNLVNAENAATYTISRYYSLDGQSFYANLLVNGNERYKDALHCASGVSYKVVRWTHAALASHWTIMNAAADEVKDTELTLTVNDKGDHIAIASSAAMTKTANFPAGYSVKLIPDAAAALAADDATQTPTEVVIDDNKITATDNGWDVDLTGLGVVPANYTLNVPAGYFTINGKLAPAMTTAVTIENDTTGIEEIGADNRSGDEVIYDLQGRRVSKAGKGIYIINGKKTLVK